MPAAPGRHHDLELPRLDQSGEDGGPDVSVTAEGEKFNFVRESQAKVPAQQEEEEEKEEAAPARQQHHFRAKLTVNISAGLSWAGCQLTGQAN